MSIAALKTFSEYEAFGKPSIWFPIERLVWAENRLSKIFDVFIFDAVLNIYAKTSANSCSENLLYNCAPELQPNSKYDFPTCTKIFHASSKCGWAVYQFRWDVNPNHTW